MGLNHEPLLVVDIDETLVQYLAQMLIWLADAHRISLSPNHFTNYDLVEAHQNAYGITPTEDRVRDWLRGFHQTPGFTNLTPLANARQVMGELSERFMVVAISGRQLDIFAKTQEMLALLFNNHIDGLIHCNQFAYQEPWVAATKKDKAISLLKLLEMQKMIAIEDSLSALLDYLSTGQLVVGYLIDYPWNQTDEQLPETIIRVPAETAWLEILADLKRRGLA